MGALAGLFKELGHDVSGSDIAFDPPMGPALESWGIRLLRGFDVSHLEPRPDLVVVGNSCRSTNVEARAAIDGGIAYTDIGHALGSHILDGTSPLVVAGTHGKTTTTTMAAWLLDRCGYEPGFLIGGLPKNFPRSFRVPRTRSVKLPVVSSEGFSPPARRVPFVIEGDEYDTAFFEKTPKFWHYRPEVAILTSIEHDHIDIYPSFEAYLAAFAGFVSRLPSHGLIVASCADEHVVRAVSDHARCEVAWYALQGDETHGKAPHWLGAIAPQQDGFQCFDLHAGGVMAGRFMLPMAGTYNVRNAIAAIGAAAQGFGASLPKLREALRQFEGVRRRQDLLGTPRGVRVYDDFAHHPTAVDETLRGLRERHPAGRLIAVFEPRSATACRAIHQDSYTLAFGAADDVILAPLGRSTIPEAERLDVRRLAEDLRRAGRSAHAAGSIEEILDRLVAQASAGDTIVLLSNGAFGGIHTKLLAALAS